MEKVFMLVDLLSVRWTLRARPCMGMVGLSPPKPKVQENYFHFGLVHRKHEYWSEHGGQPKARLQSFSLITSLKTTKVQIQQLEKAETVCQFSSLIELVPIDFAVLSLSPLLLHSHALFPVSSSLLICQIKTLKEKPEGVSQSGQRCTFMKEAI